MNVAINVLMPQHFLSYVARSIDRQTACGRPLFRRHDTHKIYRVGGISLLTGLRPDGLRPSI